MDIMDKKEQVLNIFVNEDKPLRSGEIAKMIDLESKEVSKYIKQLKSEGRIYSPKRCFYEIKK
jgi:predicted transcriptional regulator